MNALPMGRADSGFGCKCLCLCLWGRGEERGDEDTERAKRFEKKGQSRGSRQSAVWYVLQQSRPREEKGKKPERGKGRKVEDSTSQGVQRSAVQGRERKHPSMGGKGGVDWGT